MNKNIVNTKFLVSTALIAAIYVVMTLAIAPLSFGMIQIRISEVLMLMAFIDKKYAPGLVLGCFIANCFSPFGMMDVVFGTACTAASLVGITKCSKTLFGASLWPVLCNAFIGIELYLFGSPLLLSMATVAFGEFLSVSVLGYVLAAAGSAVGLGNIWRFPYLAAKDGGGLFLLVYLILVLTFGFALLTTEIAIGRKTGQGPLTAYGLINPKGKFIGVLACIVPAIILPYYCTIGGWVLKYFTLFITGSGKNAVADGYFTGFITGQWAPIIFGVVYLLLTAAIVIGGVNKGIERFSKVLMPILVVLIFAIGIFSLTLHYKDASGTVRSGLEGLKIYVIPDFKGLTMQKLFTVFVDALGQLFYSISVAMGIMVAYGSYVKKESKLMGSINQIEIFDTLVAFLAGLMIIPAVYVFMGRDGMSAGPGLMFISLPKVFNEMGIAGDIVGLIFFMIVAFAAVTSSVSIMEAIVSSLIDRFHWSRRKSAILVTVYALIAEIIVCLGYNKLYMEVKLPNGTVGQILDIMDYVSNNVLMPIVALATCILIGWIVSPKVIIDEVTRGGSKFTRKGLYIIMVKFIAPAFLLILLLQALGIVTF